MNINSAFPSTYLKAADLQGKEPVVTIDHVKIEPVGQKREMMPVLYFAGKDKGMTLNKTNARKIAAMTGTGETDEWAGFSIKLFVAQVEYQGEVVDGLRVKPAPANGGARAPKPSPIPPTNFEDEAIVDSDIPF